MRSLLAARRETLGVGFFFALGHSTVVLLLSVAAAFAARWVTSTFPEYVQGIGAVLGAGVSGVFLLLIGALNMVLLLNVWRHFHALRRGIPARQSDVAISGVMGRLFRTAFRLVTRSWHMYPLGFLFGLGFDTASEVALLGLSAGAASQGAAALGILSLPLLFAAGMTFMDTLDGVFMTRAFGWALASPMRKAYYNLSVTGLSVLVALLVGGVQLGKLLAEWLGLSGGIWSWLHSVELGSLGLMLVGLFAAVWLTSWVAWKRVRPSAETSA